MKKQYWWNEFFPDFRPVFDTLPVKDTNAQVRYIIKKMKLKPGTKLLDCPCGIGRISLPLAKKGVKVTGVDITLEYLDELAEKALKSKLKIDLMHSDMRKINFKNHFNAAMNFGTSFGYFDKESDDCLTLKKVYQALKPGGLFLLHTINRDWILKHFQSSDWQNIKDMRLLQSRKFDYSTSRMQDVWIFQKGDKEYKHMTDLRLYSYHEVLRIMEAVGFKDIECFGSIKD
jgi:cyclopropane fatty-acyl-phospholipid synthase-like methyltransferase